jgi:hypothetical protein
MSEDQNASESPPSPSRCYATDVKDAVCKLLDLVAESKWHTLAMDTDEDSPEVVLWYKARLLIVSGYPRNDATCPEKNEDGSCEVWCFLECCRRALAEAKKFA